MCDTVLSFARDQLLPIARDHWLPLLKEVTNMIRGVPTEVADIKNELESIEGFINDADRMAEAEEDNTRDGIKAKIKQLREASFRIQDVIDEYMICEGQQSHDPGCAADATNYVKTMILRLQIAYKIQDIKSLVSAMEDTGGKNHGFLQIESSLTQGSSSSAAKQNTTLNNLRKAPFYMEEAQVVGFEAPRKELINWLIEGREELTVVSVVGMGGQGKTTLAKKVFDSKEVIGHFDIYRVWITVSRLYKVEELLKEMLQKIYKQKRDDDPPPQGISEMDQDSLTNEVRKFLRNKRYVILFDDVWNEQFWNDFEYCLADCKMGSRILITTRKIDVAEYCKRSSFVQVHRLKPLNREKSLELLHKKAFFDLDGRCPENLKAVSSEIVERCEGLPLAIVAIGGLLSNKERDSLQWERFSENLSSELDNNPSINVITKILGFSFHDLPYNLKQCFLYFGIYPENYEVNTMRLIKQWVAEGFVKEETGKTVEEVAEQYLTELIHRSLVDVSSFASNSKARSCRVHGLMREMILDKIQDLSFCHFARDNEDQSVLSLMTRRLTISTSSNTLLSRNVECSNIRSLLVFRNEELPDSFVASIPPKYKLLKVFDFEDVALHHYVPKDLGDLFHLRYLSFRNTKVRNLPRSIGKLHNLETLDLRQTMVREIPKEINKLQKLRHILAYDISEGVGYGIQINDGIGDIGSLQTLREVQADHGGVKMITDLERLKGLKMLGLTNVKKEYTKAICSSISEKQHLEKLYIAAINENEVIDLNFNVSLHKLWKLRLVGKLERFPYWIRELQHLVKLSLSHSMLTHDPLTSLKDLPNLLYLSILFRAYEGEHLHFNDEGFKSLKHLVLRRLYNLQSIKIGEGALSSLEKFKLVYIPHLMEVPSGVYNLPRLQVCHIINMPDEFEQSIDRVRGQRQWIIEKVPFVGIVDRSWAHENF